MSDDERYPVFENVIHFMHGRKVHPKFHGALRADAGMEPLDYCDECLDIVENADEPCDNCGATETRRYRDG